MSFLRKATKGFSSALGSVFGGPGDLERLRLQSESAEFKRLRKFARLQQKEAAKLTTEGIGISERPGISLGFEEEADPSFNRDEEDRLTPDTGLIL